MLSLSIDASVAGAPVAPAAGAPPSHAPRAQRDERFDRIFKAFSMDRQCPAESEDGGKSGCAGTAQESRESRESRESQESQGSAKSQKDAPSDAAAPNLVMAAGLVPATPPVDVPQPVPVVPVDGSKGDNAETAQAAGHLAIDADAAARTPPGQMPWADRSSGRQVKDGRTPRAGRTASPALADDAVAAAGEQSGRFHALEDAPESAPQRTAQVQPTANELRVAAPVSNDLRSAVRAAAGGTMAGGQDAGASADRGSHGASSTATPATSRATHADAAPEVKAPAADATQLAARSAAALATELSVAPHLQYAARSSSLETAAALTLARDGAAVSSQIVESIRLQFAKGGGDAQMTLQPGYLGGLSVSLRVDKDIVTASVVAESPAVREWLRANESSLRQGLVDVGLRLEKFQVSEPSAQTPSRDAESRNRPGRERQTSPRQPRPNQSQPTFDVVAE